MNYINNRGNTGLLYQKLLNSDIIGLDIETDSQDVFTANLLLLQLEMQDDIFIINVPVIGLDFIRDLINFIDLSNKLVVGHNIKFDVKVLYNITGILLKNLYDTMLGEVLTYNGVGIQYPSLKDLIKKYFNIEIDKDVRETFINFSGNFSNEQLIYAGLDVKYLRKIREIQLNKLKEQRQLKIENIESRLIAPVCSLELNGVLIDTELWNQNIENAKSSVEKIKQEILNYIVSRIDYSKYNNLLELVDKIGISLKTKKIRDELVLIKDFSCVDKWLKENINISSPKQLLKIFEILNEISLKSTNEKELNSYKDNTLVKMILDYREYLKKITTYGKNVLDEIHPLTNRFHTDYNQLGTYTGRFTVSRLHQIPRDNFYRRCFIARPGYKIVTADYNQQEYRLAGALTGDKRIIDSYKMGLDMHSATASLLYHTDIKNITKEQRNKGKSVNFATLYWSSASGLTYNLGVSFEEAQEIITTLRKGYPTFFEFREYAGEMIWKHKKAITPLGRIRFFPDKILFDSSDDYDKYIRKVKREGFNHMIQGWGADITKMAINNIFYKNPYGDKLKLYIQLHDEIDTEVDENQAEEIAKFVNDCMLEVEQPQLGEIPAKVSYVISNSWEKD